MPLSPIGKLSKRMAAEQREYERRLAEMRRDWAYVARKTRGATLDEIRASIGAFAAALRGERPGCDGARGRLPDEEL